MKKSLQRLAKFFDCPEDVFSKLPGAMVAEWALQVGVPNYKLENWQHNFLIGQPY